jgi:PhnB protein
MAAAPAGYHTVTPYLVVKDVSALIEFVNRAFGARERMRMPRPDGSISHAEVELGDSVIMMGESESLSGLMPGVIHLYVDDVDASYRTALQAGALSLREPSDQPHGDRMAGVKDGFGNQWWIAAPVPQTAKR